MAESALLNSEESIMATFDFLGAVEAVGEGGGGGESDGEDGGQDDDNDDKFLVKRPKVKVSPKGKVTDEVRKSPNSR